MEVATGEHNLPLIPTICHFFPHGAKISHSIGKCQEKILKKKKNIPRETFAGRGVAGKSGDSESWTPFSGGPETNMLM
jgi:hypothetical protein